MKYAVIVPDGMADYPLEVLDGKTVMEAAHTPNMDKLARLGEVGMLRTIPEGMEPGSDVANLSLFGYDPSKCFTGRAPLEALNLGIELDEKTWAFRCNLITVEDGKLLDYSAGQIPTDEARPLVEALDRELGNDQLRFHTGVGYRHIVIDGSGGDFDVVTTAPHNVMDEPIGSNLPRGAGAEKLLVLMEASRAVLAEEPVNRARVARGDRPANMIWLWGQGKAPSMQPFKERFGVTGATISAVNLVHGIARALGMRSIDVPGITGYYDTDYAAKGRAALRALEDVDLVFVHVEAPDEAGHNGQADEKVLAVERIDEMVVGPVAELVVRGENLRALVAPDHYTPTVKRTHSREPVPFLIAGGGVEPNGAKAFSEKEAARTGLQMAGWDAMGRLIERP